MASSDEQTKPPEASAAAAAAAPVAPAPHPEWAASLQAYYATAGHPYAWPAQHLMAAAAAGAPYGAPMPFPAVYHPGAAAAAAAYYAHAHTTMAAGVPYPAGEAAVAPVAVEGRSKGKGGGGGVSPEKGSSAAPSGDDASRSGESGSDESSETREDDAEQKDSSAAKKRKSSNSYAEGEPSQVAAAQYAFAESPFPVKGRSATKLPVSAPGRAALPSATPNLNIGMDLWGSSQALAVPSGQGEVSAGLAVPRRDGVVSELDERELKRERRKQSNRESARRSRLRKQQECEELARKVTDLSTENGALRTELDQLKQACEDMESENSRLMDEMVQSQGRSILTTLGIHGDASKAHRDNNGQFLKHANSNTNGSFMSGSHNPDEVNSR